MIGRVVVCCLVAGCSARPLPLPEDLGVPDLEEVADLRVAPDLRVLPDLRALPDLRPPPPPDLACAPPGMPTRPWCAQFAEAWSARMSRCRGGTVESWRPKAWFYCAVWEASLRAGRVQFREDQTAACLASLAETSCEGLDAFTDDPSHPCRQVWPGGPGGAICRSGFDCQDGECQRVFGHCEGTCVAATGLCDPIMPAACAYPARCVSTKVGDQCRYGEPDGVHFSGFHDETCLEGHCSTTDDGDISYYCIPPAADGTACNGCCDGADACVNGVCVRRPAAGEPCSAYGQCQWDSKCDVAAGVCVPNVPPAPCDACLLE